MEEMSLEQGLEEIGHKILVLTRNELYMKMRFMDVGQAVSRRLQSARNEQNIINFQKTKSE